MDTRLGEGFDGRIEALLGFHRIQGIACHDLIGEEHELVVMKLGKPTVEQELLVAVGTRPERK